MSWGDWGEGWCSTAPFAVLMTRHTGSEAVSVPVPTFTGNKMASSNLLMREEQPPDRPEPAQNKLYHQIFLLARDWFKRVT